MRQPTNHEQLWGSGSRRLYWWHLPVNPSRTAALGREMIVTLFVWIAAMIVLIVIADYLLAATA